MFSVKLIYKKKKCLEVVFRPIIKGDFSFTEAKIIIVMRI